MNTRFSRRARLAALVASIALVTATAAACDDDDDPSDEDIRAVEETIRIGVESSPAEVETLLARLTDNMLATTYFATREECLANAEECVGEPSTVESISDIEVDGDTATATVTWDFGTFIVGLVREDGIWRADTLKAASDDLPDGADAVDLELVDFAFGFDRGDIPAGGNFAFRVRNSGEQTHEVVLVAIPSGSSVEEAVEAVGSEEMPPLGLKVYIRPGQEDVHMVFEAPLEPGNYALVCFFPDTTDPEFAAHVEKGMIAEFTVE